MRTLYDHPIWWEPHEVRAGVVDTTKVPRIADRFDVIELNAGRSIGMNLVAAGIARACTLAAGDDWPTFLDNVWRGESRQRVASLTRASVQSMADAMIDAVLDADESVQLGRKVTRVQSQLLENAVSAVLQSKFVRDFTPARASLRAVLRRVSSRVIGRWMEYEKGLEHHVMSGELGSYLLLNAALGPKGPAEDGSGIGAVPRRVRTDQGPSTC